MLDETEKQFLSYLTGQKKAPATIIAYGKDVDQLVSSVKALGRSSFSEVIKEDLDSFIKKLRDDGFTPKTISRKINSIKTFYRFLKIEGKITINPAQELTHPKYELKAPRILNKMEYRALRDVCRRDARTYAIMELFLQAGLRISEVANLKMTEVDKDKLVVNGRDIALNPSVVDALQRYISIRIKSDKPHIFITKTGNPLLIRNIRTTIDRALKMAGVENTKVNDLRATFIAYQLAAGVPIDYISKLVGHKRISTTERYIDLVKEKPRKTTKLVEL